MQFKIDDDFWVVVHLYLLALLSKIILPIVRMYAFPNRFHYASSIQYAIYLYFRTLHAILNSLCKRN